MRRKTKMKTRILEWLAGLILLSLVLTPSLVLAVDLNSPPTAEDKAAFDNILVPVMKIYNFIKYAASAIAVIALLFAGISYMTAGNDPKKRDNSKGLATYVLIGLVIIWAAPFVVNMLIT
jgi:type IV secretory pathway VirB2 component (pilin)